MDGDFAYVCIGYGRPRRGQTLCVLFFCETQSFFLQSIADVESSII